MCGITGYWHKTIKASKAAFDGFTDSLAHRGPDGRGVFFDPNTCLYLGHRRLSIIDLSETSSQPFSDPSQRYVMTYNGELYNYVELREELIKKGYTFKTSGDTEVLLFSYIEWGQNCLYKLNGMWAFAIFDKKKQSLFLSRDRFGVKPLYYFNISNALAFASELKAFMHLPDHRVDFNSHFIQKQLQEGVSTYSEETFLENVYELLPGHAAYFQLGHPVHVYRWWDSQKHLPQIPSSKKEQIEHFRTLLFDACRLRLRSDAKLGFSVSGGLDSSSVLCSTFHCVKSSKAFELSSSSWNNAFTALYPNTPQDESLHFNSVTQQTESCCYPSLIQPTDFDADLLQKMSYFYESLVDLPLGPWKIYENFRQQKTFVSLEGHGPDELMGGYHHQIHDLLLRDKNLSPFQYFHLKKTYQNFFSQEKTNHIQGKVPKQKRRLKKLFSRHKTFDEINARFFQDFHFGSLPYILRNFDRVSMAHGIEVRSPFLDWRLVCYILALPSSMKVAHGYTKYILRQAMRGILPPSIRTRKSKMGFADPLTLWIKPYFQDFVLDHLNSRFFLESPHWDGLSLKQTTFKNTQPQDLLHLWKYIITSSLIQKFLEKQKAPLLSTK